MLVRIRFSRLLPVLLLLPLVHLPASNAQNVEPFKFFRDYVGLKEDQIAEIRNGKAVAKVVESRTPDEVFVFGSVYVQSTPEKYLKLASDIDALRKLPSYLAIRKFSDPPQLSDLDGFTLDADDIKQLKNCEPGECDVQLPADAMDAFKQSVNWSVPDAANQANQLAQKMALEAIHRYTQEETRPLEPIWISIIRPLWERHLHLCSAVRKPFPFICQNWTSICSTIRTHNQKTFSPNSIGRKYSLDSNPPFELCRP